MEPENLGAAKRQIKGHQSERPASGYLGHAWANPADAIHLSLHRGGPP